MKASKSHVGEVGRKIGLAKIAQNVTDRTSEAVERAKILRAEGLTYREIVKILNEQKYRNSLGKHWTIASLAYRITK